jgi:pimeloyl-ACP methyl ester carboxylesterase
MPQATGALQQLVRTIYDDNADIFTADFPLIRFWQPTRPAAVDRLGSIRVPTQIVTGDCDGAAARQTAETIHDAIAGSSLEIITGAGHLVNLDGSGAFDRVVLSFLER